MQPKSFKDILISCVILDSPFGINMPLWLFKTFRVTDSILKYPFDIY